MADVDLLLFAGGDGTARDIVSAGVRCTVIGVPAGVKIHSPVYATRPERAGELALRFLQGGCRHTREAEVVDIDETSYRDGRVCTSLYGYLNVPDDRDFLQHGKAPSPASEHTEQENIAAEMYTKNAAYSSYEENIKGTITAGKLADFVVIDDDIFEMDPLKIKDIKVKYTYLGGKLVYERNKK